LLYWLHEPTLDIGAKRDKAAKVTRVTRAVLAATRGRAARAASIALLVAAAAIAVAPFAAPTLAHLALERIASAHQWTGRAGRVHFDPFSLAFDIDDMQVSGPYSDVAATARNVRIDFSLHSFFLARPVLDSLEIRHGSLQGTPRAASVMWPLIGTLAADASIATLDADVAEMALTRADDYETLSSTVLHGTGLDFGSGRGTLAIAASNALGDGSRVEATLTAEPAVTGARLRGAATLTRGQLAVAGWTLGAPSAAVAVDATLSSMGMEASFTLVNGVIAAVDRGAPAVRIELVGASAIASWHSWAGFARLQGSASLADGGSAELELLRPSDGSLPMNAQLSRVPVTTWREHVSRALGAEPAGGAITVEVSIGAPDAASFARLTAHDLRLATEAATANTAIAVLEDRDGDISMQIPLSSDRPAAEQIVEHMSERTSAAGMAPFAALAALVGRDAGEISTIEFVPGNAEPTTRGREAIAALAAALRLRERVGVRIEANESAELDRDALARSQVTLHVTLATAQAERAQRAPAQIDFASQRAQEVLDEFAKERLPAEALEEIGASFAFGADAPPAAPLRVAYYRALFEALVAREPIMEAALRRLASFRVQAVERLLADMGVDASRVIDRAGTRPVGDGILALLPLALEPPTVSEAGAP
jgi:hypothetical protein